MALKHATKLMALYEKQLRTLQKSKGNGQQKVTVEHVHVEAGGQAIVGNVEAGTSNAPSTASSPAPAKAAQEGDPAPQRIPQTADMPFDATAKEGARRRRRGS